MVKFWGRALFWVAPAKLLLHSHMVKRQRGETSFLVTLRRALIPFMKTPPPWAHLILIISQRPCLPLPSHVGVGFQYMNFREIQHSVHSGRKWKTERIFSSIVTFNFTRLGSNVAIIFMPPHPCIHILWLYPPMRVWACLCVNLWPVEYAGSDSMPDLSLGLKKPYTLLPHFLKNATTLWRSRRYVPGGWETMRRRAQLSNPKFS